jgi:hypothetical protein
MGKWDGYDWVVVSVRPVKGGNTISDFKVRKVFGSCLGNSTIQKRKEVLKKLEDGVAYVTATQGEYGLEPVDELDVVPCEGEKFIRVEPDARNNDYLGELPEF